MGGALGNAHISERLAISSTIVSAVGEAAGAAVARGTSTKSAFSDRGDWRGGDVERRGETRRSCLRRTAGLNGTLALAAASKVAGVVSLGAARR